ncbi:MAG: lactate racemase domain-containing protein [Planctomycetota bacterium]
MDINILVKSLRLKTDQSFQEMPNFIQSFKANSLESALQSPVGLPQLEKCVTPDDKVTIAIDPPIFNNAFKLSALLSALGKAGIGESQITLLLPGYATDLEVEKVTEFSGGCSVVQHNSEDLLNKSIIGSSRSGENVYLNRRLVEADFLIIACGTQQINNENSPASLISKGMSYFAPNGPKGEALGLLGSPYLIMHVNGPSEGESHWVAGNMEAFRIAKSLRRKIWTCEISLAPDLIILDIQKGFSFFELAELANRLTSTIENGGRIVIIGNKIIEDSRISHLASWVLSNPDSHDVRREADPTIRALRLWSTIISKASVFLHQVLPFEACEDVQANIISNINEIQRLVNISNNILLISNPLKCVLKRSW